MNDFCVLNGTAESDERSSSRLARFVVVRVLFLLWLLAAAAVFALRSRPWHTCRALIRDMVDPIGTLLYLTLPGALLLLLLRFRN